MWATHTDDIHIHRRDNRVKVVYSVRRGLGFAGWVDPYAGQGRDMQSYPSYDKGFQPCHTPTDAGAGGRDPGCDGYI